MLRIEPVTLPSPSRPEVARRVAKGIRSFTRHVGGATWRQRGRLDEASVARALRLTFADLGGTFAKFGQLIASSPSIFGDEVAHEFRGFLDTGPPVPPADVRAVVEADLGRPMGELYGSFEPEPMAAASLAVVHRATLPDGTPVAVKVLRPNVEHVIATDLAVLRPICGFVARQVAVGIAGTLEGLVDGLATQIAEEVDLANEARAIRWFDGVLADLDAKHVRVPALFDDLCGHRVLTMELVTAVAADDTVAIAAMGVDPAPLLRDALQSWFATTMCAGAFHGDIHAGNLLVQPDGTLVVVDWGIVGRLDEDTAKFFRRLIEGVLGDEAAWVDVAAHIEKTYGSGLQEMLGVDEAGFVDFWRTQIEPVMRLPFGQVDLRTMLIGDGAVDGKRAGERTRREAFANWREERRRQRALMASEGYGGQFDQAMFLLSKQLVYFDRYGKMFLPDVPLLDDPDAFRALVDATNREQPRGARE